MDKSRKIIDETGEEYDPELANTLNRLDNYTVTPPSPAAAAALLASLKPHLQPKESLPAEQAERDIGVSLGAGTLPALAATAHRLKGSALAVGARRLAEVAAGLEQAGRTGDRAACQDGLGALARELRRVAGEIGG